MSLLDRYKTERFINRKLLEKLRKMVTPTRTIRFKVNEEPMRASQNKVIIWNALNSCIVDAAERTQKSRDPKNLGFEAAPLLCTNRYEIRRRLPEGQVPTIELGRMVAYLSDENGKEIVCEAPEPYFSWEYIGALEETIKDAGFTRA